MIQKVLKYLGKQFQKTFSKAYVTSLIIAVLLWSLIKFSALYQERVSFQVQLNHLPETHVLLNNSTHRINCVVQATGFRILLLKYWVSEIMEIDFNDLEKSEENNSYYFNLEESDRSGRPRWLNQAQEVTFDNSIILFNIEELQPKTVKVEPRLQLEFKQGYILDEVLLDRDSIRVLVPKSKSNIRRVYTYEKKILDLTASTEVDLSIDLPNSWKLVDDTKKVKCQIKVDQLTEGEFNLPLEKKNGVDIKYFPSRVEIKYSVPSKKFNTISVDNFVIEVEEVNSETQQNKSLKVNVVSKPSQAQILSINPAEVEFLIFDDE